MVGCTRVSRTQCFSECFFPGEFARHAALRSELADHGVKSTECRVMLLRM